ncbi:MAG: hypothetical protein ACR2K1_07570, partial [Saprospiraceae bacterium]
ALAQPGKPEARSERIQAYRIAVFTETLQLTPEEAQGFWPVYNSYTDKREALQTQYKPSKQLEAMSDNEVEDQIKRHFEKQQKDLDLEKTLYQDLRKVLPLRKIARLPSAEREFRESLLKKMQEIREKRQQVAPRRPRN